MSQLLPRFYRRQLEREDADAVARAVREAEAVQAPRLVAGATAAGDSRRLRGIPVAGGACGTSPGTDPLYALLRTSDRMR